MKGETDVTREEEVAVTLTKAEAQALAQHLDYYIIQEAKDFGDEYDNMKYLRALVHIYERCEEAFQ